MEFLKEKLMVSAHYDEIAGRMLCDSIPAEPNIGELPGLFNGSDFYNLANLRKRYGEKWKKISAVFESYIKQKGGKRQRSLLTLAGYTTFSGGNYPTTKTIETAVGVEFLHEAALILDDVMDNSTTRRGALSLWAKIAADVEINNNEAKKIAAELGLLCFAWARYLIIDKSGEKIRADMSDIFWGAVNKMKKGQVLDVASTSASKWPKLEEAIECEYLKTATYSVELPLLVSLCVAENAENVREEISEDIKMFARGFGLAFQLQDDILFFKTSVEIGKNNIIDAVNGNKIPLVIIARQLANEEQKIFLDLVWGCPEKLNQENIQKLKNIFIETGALEKINQMILEETKNAKNALRKIKEAGFDTSSIESLLFK